MKFRHYAYIALTAAVCATACKDDDDSTSIPGLNGLSINSASPYVRVGTTLEFRADVSGIVTTDNSEPGAIGIYWQVNTAGRDTLSRDINASNPVFSYRADTVGTYTIYSNVYASGYYNSSATATFKAIVPETALSGLSGTPDLRLDGNSYRSFTAGGKTWLGNNLYGAGHAFYGAEVLDSVIGNYYTWEEAREACPAGWHLPSGEEFDALGGKAADFMADVYFLDDKMWEYWPDMAITNSLGFNGIPAGYMDLTRQENPESGFMKYALWWTADEVDAERASFRYIYEQEPEVQKGQGSKTSLALNVRCVQD